MPSRVGHPISFRRCPSRSLFLRLVRGQQQRTHGSGAFKEAERVGSVRHHRKRLGVVPRSLARRLHGSAQRRISLARHCVQPTALLCSRRSLGYGCVSLPVVLPQLRLGRDWNQPNRLPDRGEQVSRPISAKKASFIFPHSTSRNETSAAPEGLITRNGSLPSIPRQRMARNLP